MKLEKRKKIDAGKKINDHERDRDREEGNTSPEVS